MERRGLNEGVEGGDWRVGRVKDWKGGRKVGWERERLGGGG